MNVPLLLGTSPARFRYGTCALLLTLLSCWSVRAQETKQPVYVGSRECAKCHQGSDFGYQQCLMLLHAHSRAYASLARPEAKEIARLSGIPQEPQESPVCLGCHATASEAEEWEMDDTFHREDGVQCEKCHGPGSEYMDEAVMTDRQASRAAGLMMPTKKDCLNCHDVKGSHVAVLQSPAFDVDQAWEALAHPTPGAWDYIEPHVLPAPINGVKNQYVGSITCAQCHKGPGMGYQYSKWRQSPHARAYAVLGTEQARTMAQQAGVKGDPITAPECLKCHATAYHDPAGGAADSYTVYEGVGCEACHGAGSEFALEAIMRDKTAAVQAGLKKVDRETCATCHESRMASRLTTRSR